MKPLRLCAKLAALTLAVAAAWISLLYPYKAIANDDDRPRFGQGASYLTTVVTSTGAFRNRFVIALHADHMVSVVDSNSGGPTFFFTGELGSWESDRKGQVVARTIEFGTPQSPGTVVRVDYTISFQNGGRQIVGTLTVTSFPLQANPFGGGGTTTLGPFNFTGVLITP
jgi:hypothetical protein